MLQNFRKNRDNFINCVKQQNALKEQENSQILSSSFFYSWDFKKTVPILLSNKKIENPKSQMESSCSSSDIKTFLSNANPDFYLAVTPSKDPPLSSIKIKKKKDLIFLDLTSCYISSLDSLKGLHKLSSLQYLCLSDCGIVDLPNDIVNLPKTIRSLDLSSNFISQISADIHWKQLEYLNLSENSFSKWPSAIDPDKLPNLISINCSINSIESFPPLVTSFTKLQSLMLDYNPFGFIPNWLSKCIELRFLSLSGCTNLKDLQLSLLFNLPHLSFLNISNVPIRDDQSLSKVPKSLNLIICTRNKKVQNFALSIRNTNYPEEISNSVYLKNNISISDNNEFDYSVWDLG